MSLNHLSYPSFYPTIVCVRARASVCARGVSQYAHFLSGGRRRRVLTQLRSHAAARPGKCISMFAHSSVHSFVRSFVCLFVRPLLGTRFDSDVGAQRLDTGARAQRAARKAEPSGFSAPFTNKLWRQSGHRLLGRSTSGGKIECPPGRAETGWLPADYYMWHLHAPTRVDLAAAARELNHSRRDLSRRRTTMGARLHTLQYHRFGAAKEVARLFVSSAPKPPLDHQECIHCRPRTRRIGARSIATRIDLSWTGSLFLFSGLHFEPAVVRDRSSPRVGSRCASPIRAEIARPNACLSSETHHCNSADSSVARAR